MVDTILVTPPELRTKASDIRQHANNIQNSINIVEQEVKALSVNEFEGYSADRFRTHYNRIRDHIFGFRAFVESFAKALEDAAAVFEQADK